MKRALATALLAVSTGLSSTAFAADSRKFDYVCDGFQTFQKGDLSSGHTRLRQHLRIDLAAGKWCEAACERVRDIKSSDGGRIVLSDAAANGSHEHTEISRLNRTLRSTLGEGFGSGFSGLVTVSRCQVAPFTPVRPRE